MRRLLWSLSEGIWKSYDRTYQYVVHHRLQVHHALVSRSYLLMRTSSVTEFIKDLQTFLKEQSIVRNIHLRRARSLIMPLVECPRTHYMGGYWRPAEANNLKRGSTQRQQMRRRAAGTSQLGHNQSALQVEKSAASLVDCKYEMAPVETKHLLES